MLIDACKALSKIPPRRTLFLVVGEYQEHHRSMRRLAGRVRRAEVVHQFADPHQVCQFQRTTVPS